MTPTQRGRLETLLYSIDTHYSKAYTQLCLGNINLAKEQLILLAAARQAASELVGSTN